MIVCPLTVTPAVSASAATPGAGSARKDRDRQSLEAEVAELEMLAALGAKAIANAKR